MQVNISYDDYNTKIKKAILTFGEDLDEQNIELEVTTEIIGEGEESQEVEKVNIKSIDNNDFEISNKMDREELKKLLMILRNLIGQMK